MLILLNQPEKLLRGLVISKSPEIKIRKKDDLLLVINTENGLWTILDPQFQSFFNKLSEPVFYKDFIANDQGIPPAMYISFLEETYKKGIINLSGKKSDVKHTEKSNDNRLSGTLIFEIDKGSVDFVERIKSFAGRRFSAAQDGSLIIKFSGNTASVSNIIENLTLELSGLASDHNKTTHFRIDNCKGIEERDFSRTGMTINYEYKAEELLSGENPPDEIINTTEQIVNKGIRKSIKVLVNSPDQFKPVLNMLLESNCANIALKIDPQVFLGEAPITASIRKMEDMASAYIEAVDYGYRMISDKHTRIILADVHRFLTRASGSISDHPCNSSPCGMGDKVQVLRETGGLQMCRCLSEKTASKMKITEEDINCPQQSEVFKYWKTDRVQATPVCKRCLWKRLCGGGCPSLTYEKYGSINREDPRCRFFSMVYENLIWKIHKTPLIVRKLGGYES